MYGKLLVVGTVPATALFCLFVMFFALLVVVVSAISTVAYAQGMIDAETLETGISMIYP